MPAHRHLPIRHRGTLGGSLAHADPASDHRRGCEGTLLRKRQVKAPEVYVRDTGLLHELLGIEDHAAWLHHPKLGASWEGFAIAQVLATESHERCHSI